MRRARLVVLAAVLPVALIGCDDSQATPDAAKTDPSVCKANLEAAIDRSCSVPADCVLVASADCCGRIMLGVHAGTDADFASVESTYEACLACPPLGCAHQDQAEDGSVAQNGHAIVATCTAGRCVSVVQ